MKSKTNLLIFFFLPVSCFSQIKFEKGYLIDLDNKRTECLIENHDWKNNPNDFEYKLSENDVAKKVTVSSVKEFGINSQSRYVAADVKIDRTGENLEEITTDRNPVWLKERLFLNVLIESKISLLYYADGNLRRYFYQKDDTVKQLIYKKYLMESGDSKVNDAFHQQLRADVQCGNMPNAELKRVDYTKSDLMKYFKNYNECSGAETKEFTEFIKNRRKSLFHVKLTPGINYTSLSVSFSDNKPYSSWDVDFGKQLDFRMGMELEWILPYNRNKWGIVWEPGYQTFSSTIVGTTTSTAKVNTFELPLGLRYYFFLSDKSRIFINGFYVFTLPGESSVRLQKYDYEVTCPAMFAIGAGYDFRRFSGEIRYYTNGDILNDYMYWTAPYERLSFILGYRMF